MIEILYFIRLDSKGSIDAKPKSKTKYNLGISRTFDNLTIKAALEEEKILQYKPHMTMVLQTIIQRLNSLKQKLIILMILNINYQKIR